MVKNLPAVQETRIGSLGWEDPLEKGMTTHSSILAWRILWMEEPGGLQSTGSQRVGHDWATNLLCLGQKASIRIDSPEQSPRRQPGWIWGLPGNRYSDPIKLEQISGQSLDAISTVFINSENWYLSYCDDAWGVSNHQVFLSPFVMNVVTSK